MKTSIQKLIIALAWLALPMLGLAQFNYTINSRAVTITGYTGSGGAVTIPATINGHPVTSIGASAFLDSSLTSVTIPNTITNIGDSAFYGCIDLPGVTIPNSVTSIGQYAFEECYSLANVIIPS